MLFTPEEVLTITAGHWIRRPGPEWNPTMVRSTNVQAIDRRWLAGGIIFVTKLDQLSKWFGREAELSEPARGCVVLGPKFAASPHVPRHRAVLGVPNLDNALKALAMFARAWMRGKLVAVTGTVGKSTTKSMLAHILGGAFTNIENGNLRPKLLQAPASMPEDIDVAVMEMGMGWHKGALRELSTVARPDMVVLTNVDVAHLDKITDKPVTREQAIELVTEEKLQLAERMRPGGALAVNAAVPSFQEIRRSHSRVLSFGEAPGADAILLSSETDGSGTRVSAEVRGVTVSYRIPLPAASWLSTASRRCSRQANSASKSRSPPWRSRVIGRSGVGPICPP